MSKKYNALTGNLNTRMEKVSGKLETFAHDENNRLLSWLVQSTGADSKPTLHTLMAYGGNGNVRYKSDVGEYRYPAPNEPQPHAVREIVNGSHVLASYRYDASGNLIYQKKGAIERTLELTSFNLPSVVQTRTNGVLTHELKLVYGIDGQRVRSTNGGVETIYAEGCERITRGGVVKFDSAHVADLGGRV